MSQPVGLTTGQHSSRIRPESASRLVVFVYLIVCAVTLWVRWGKNHYLLRSRSCPPISSYILLVSGGCSVLTPRKPTGIGYWNSLPVPIPLTLKSVVTITARRSDQRCLPDLQDPGQDRRSRYICIQLSTHIVPYIWVAVAAVPQVHRFRAAPSKAFFEINLPVMCFLCLHSKHVTKKEQM